MACGVAPVPASLTTLLPRPPTHLDHPFPRLHFYRLHPVAMATPIMPPPHPRGWLPPPPRPPPPRGASWSPSPSPPSLPGGSRRTFPPLTLAARSWVTPQRPPPSTKNHRASSRASPLSKRSFPPSAAPSSGSPCRQAPSRPPPPPPPLPLPSPSAAPTAPVHPPRRVARRLHGRHGDGRGRPRRRGHRRRPRAAAPPRRARRPQHPVPVLGRRHCRAPAVDGGGGGGVGRPHCGHAQNDARLSAGGKVWDARRRRRRAPHGPLVHGDAQGQPRGRRRRHCAGGGGGAAARRLCVEGGGGVWELGRGADGGGRGRGCGHARQYGRARLCARRHRVAGGARGAAADY
ncbi:hypothetical protein BU14_0052s0087 [Porphyra umbilicalis]|uniref:Uncharacterized protein n=1 Tax=Porphyra umbilicalis TaxID=2786 RepID=A0A1X6PHW7_PORUM|nr:hypothetical protein BU14_0052s0087 [Porphyra umbilicalis]|eukprot:OSX80474.1 hypothetical protein BU14_0052s0087 [Porphyra umbilicalis]